LLKVLRILDDDDLYRRIAPYHVKSDGIVSSAAFRTRQNPYAAVSVDLAKLTSPQETLSRARQPGFGVGSLVARVPRSLGLTVEHNPCPNNIAHSLIKGQNTKSNCRRMAEATEVIVHPDGT